MVHIFDSKDGSDICAHFYDQKHGVPKYLNHSFNTDDVEIYQCKTEIHAQGVKLLTKLKVSLIRLNDHRFSNSLQNYVNPLCLYSLQIEFTIRFFLHCHHNSNLRSTLLKTVKSFMVILLLSLNLN